MNELQRTKSWFDTAIPNPTDEQKAIQIGCHFEEVFEMQECLSENLRGEHISDLSYDLKRYPGIFAKEIEDMDKNDLLDSLVDQIVTAVGVGHMMGFDILGALAEVNRSNFSKFEDGKPVFDAHGKISKGKDYTPPKLDSFI